MRLVDGQLVPHHLSALILRFDGTLVFDVLGQPFNAQGLELERVSFSSSSCSSDYVTPPICFPSGYRSG